MVRRSMAVLLLIVATTFAAFAGGQGEGAATAAEGPLEIKWMSGLYEAVPDMNNTWWTEYQKMTNTRLDIQWIPSGDYQSKFDLVIASGDLPDIIVALNETPGAWNYLKVDGSIWGIPRNRPQIDLQFKIRKDWLEKLGVAMPTTFAEWQSALKKIVNSDVDGNGKMDTFGLVGDGFLLNDSHGVMMAGFGVLDLQYDADGGLMHNYLKDNYVHMVEWLRGMYADNCIPQEFSVMKRLAAEELFSTGRAASYTRNIWRDLFFEERIRNNQPDAEVVSMPPLKSPYGTAAFLAKGVYGANYISKKVPREKAVRILKYMNEIATEDYLYMTYYGLEGIHFNWENGVRVLTEKGKAEVGTSVMQPQPLVKNTWAKVVYPAAPKEYNDAKLEEVAIIAEIGKINPFEVLISDTWTQVWPQYENEWQAMTVKAIVGQISIQDYRAYQQKLRGMPEFKKSFQEFAANYQDKFGGK
jgi:putative aldouronate transport system substrate-binding protein